MTISPGRNTSLPPRHPAAEYAGHLRPVRWAGGVAALAALVVAFVHSSRGVEDTRLDRGDAAIAASRTVFLGLDNWYLIFEIGSLLMFVLVWGIAIRRSHRHGKWTPTLVMLTVTTSLVWLDPIMNWAPYASYDPRMLHFDVDWPWFDLAPTVEPWAVIIGYGYFFLIPAWFTLALFRAVAGRGPARAWWMRRPRLGVLALSVPVCVLWDAVMESLFVRMGLYSYTQVVPWGSVSAGERYQFPLIWEAVLFGLVLSAAAPLMWRDDRGRIWSEIVATRIPAFRTRPNLGACAVALALMSVVYLGYGLSFAAIRISGIATSTATPWPFPDSATYDPQGYYQQSGQPGPFTTGTWGGWEHRRGDP